MQSEQKKDNISQELFELIQNLQNKLNLEKNNNEINDIQIEKNDNPIANLINNINQNNSEKNSDINSKVSEQNNGLNIDLNTIMNFQKILTSMNRSDPRKNLLNSLKPFLRKSRQDKINEYITILTVTSALGLFGDKGSD